MEISILQAILLGTLYYLTNNGTPALTGLGSVSVRQPIVCGTITGLILGDVVQGCIIGATINTLYLGFVNAGGTLPADAGIGGIVGTALALSSGSSAEAAIAIAVPLGIMGTMIWTLRQTVNIYFVHKMDHYAETGDTKKMAFWQLWPAQIFCILRNSDSSCIASLSGCSCCSRSNRHVIWYTIAYIKCNRQSFTSYWYCHAA